MLKILVLLLTAQQAFKNPDQLNMLKNKMECTTQPKANPIENTRQEDSADLLKSQTEDLEQTEVDRNLSKDKEPTMEAHVEILEVKDEKENVQGQKTLVIPSSEQTTLKHIAREKGTKKIKSPGKKTFSSNLLVFIIGLMMGSMSNLFTYMVRIYKRSIPEFKLNMVVLLNYYCVECMNLIVCVQVY